MSALVAFAAWVAFNGRLLWEILKIGLGWMTTTDASDIALFAGLSCVVGPTGAALILAWAVRKGEDRSGLWRFVISLVACPAAGFVGWGSATVLFQAVCGMGVMSAKQWLVVPALGALLQLPVGLAIGLLWGASAGDRGRDGPASGSGSGGATRRGPSCFTLRSDNPLRIQYETTVGDARAFLEAEIRRKLGRKIWVILVLPGILSGLAVYGLVSADSHHPATALTWGAGTAVAAWVLGAKVARDVPAGWARKACSEDTSGDTFGWHTLELTPAGITRASGPRQTTREWHAVGAVTFTKHHIFIYTGESSAHVVRREFVTGEFARELVGRLPADRLRGVPWERSPERPLP